MKPGGVWMSCTKKEGERGPARIRVSQISPLHTQVLGHGKSVQTRFKRVVDLEPSSGIRTIRITPFSLHRDVCIRSNMPWRP